MVQIQDILYVRFRVPDLDQASAFLDDFGFSTEGAGSVCLARGTDPARYVYVAEEGSPEFLGLGFSAVSQSDVESAAKQAGVVVEEIELPGGGIRARLQDPDGVAVDVVYGVDVASPLPAPARPPLNSGSQRRRLGARVQFPGADHIVKRLGHCVMNVSDFRRSERWYKDLFGLITSDEIYIEKEDDVLGAFFRCARGEEYVDHHTLFLVGTGTPGFNHAAFEVEDWDALMLSHDRLHRAGRTHRWGVGKHILGSQVFDYWKDPFGFTLEHFTDGDLFNESFGSHKRPLQELMGVLWGPQGSP